MKPILQIMERVAFTSDLVDTIGIIAYVLEALALYTIAKRRGIRKPWLAWIPVVNVWILGSISDQYRYVTKREVKNKRKVLLGLNIATCAIAMVILLFLAMILVGFGMSAIEGFLGTFQGGNIDELIALFTDNIASLIIILVLSLVLSVMTVFSAVYYWIAMYDLLRSCDPSNATVFLIVGIVGGFFIDGIHTIFMLICRNKDIGMPSRKTEAVPIVEIQAEEP